MVLRNLKKFLSSPRAHPPAEKFLDEFCEHCRDNEELEALLDIDLDSELAELIETLADFAQRKIDGEIT